VNFSARSSLEPLHERAEDRELTMQAHCGAADAAKHLAPFAHVIGEDLLLDPVELGRGIVGIAIDRIDHMLQKHLQKRRRSGNQGSAANNLARDVHRA
jgi:hypothetical protein